MKKTAIAVGALCLLAVGWFSGRQSKTGGEGSSPPIVITRSPNEKNNSASESTKPTADQLSASSPYQLRTQSLITEIQSVLAEAPELRNTKLLPVLERSTQLPLSKELIAVMQEVVDQGDLESSQYVISLMEQREEKMSVDFLVKALSNPQDEISERALFACEAVAGSVLADAQAARQWAATWKPDPQRTDLFAPDAQQDIVPSSILPGPRNHTNAEKTPEK